MLSLLALDHSTAAGNDRLQRYRAAFQLVTNGSTTYPLYARKYLLYSLEAFKSPLHTFNPHGQCKRYVLTSKLISTLSKENLWRKTLIAATEIVGQGCPTFSTQGPHYKNYKARRANDVQVGGGGYSNKKGWPGGSSHGNNWKIIPTNTRFYTIVNQSSIIKFVKIYVCKKVIQLL